MAETLLSPGVLARENDLTVTAQTPISVGAAIVGPTVKGIPYVPKRITSFTEYLTYFGGAFLSGSTQYTYFTSTAAYNYFLNGGTSLWVTRVVSGSFTTASCFSVTSSQVAANIEGVVNGVQYGSTTAANTSSSFKLIPLSYGANQNSSGSTDVSGSLANGTPDNLRYEIVSPNTANGTFTLLVRRGDDNTNNKIVLETWTNLSLDPFAPNYIAKVIGDYEYNYNATNNQIAVTGSYPNASKYIRVKSVINPTPQYFDNNGVAKAAFTGLIPLNQSGSFGGATGTIATNGQFYDTITDGNRSQGIPSGSYTNMISLLSNQDDYQFNVLLTPGLFSSTANLGASQVTTAINNTQNRGDAIYVTDLVPFSSSISEVTTHSNARNTSYAAAYWPWVQTIDPDSAQLVWVPASTMIGGVYAFNDNVSEPWFAPAGINRGGLNTVIRAQYKLTQANKDDLYEANINPLASLPKEGVVVFGQKTLQKEASALDRVNVRRLLIELKGYIRQVADTVVFEQNTNATRNSFLARVTPYLQIIQQKQGLYAFKVVMDDTNNTPDIVDRNILYGQIYLQPTKTAEFIYLDFNITPTGASFPA